MSVTETHCLIIGAGVIGAATFSRLQRSGVNCLLIDRGRGGGGATGWSGAVIRVSHRDQASCEQAAFGRRTFLDFVQRIRAPSLFSQCGYLHVDVASQLEKTMERLDDLSVAYQFWDRSELRKRFPELAINADGAIWEPESGYMDPGPTTAALIDVGLESGGAFWEGVAFEGLDAKPANAFGEGRAFFVRTSVGVVRARAIVFAAGPQTPDLLDKIGAPASSLYAQIVQVSLFVNARPLENAPAITDETRTVNLRHCPRRKGLYVGLPTGERCFGDETSSLASISHQAKTMAAGVDLIGWLRGASMHGALRHADCYARGRPEGVVDAAPGAPPGIFLASGFSGGGFKMAPFAAERMAELIDG
ncbi:MAG: FAD-binding oxidoreductase [Pseudomonadota bacterium]